jgi:hypothetical protein
MFERFTEESRRALFFARATALEAGRDSIEPEHLLAGVTRAAPTTPSGESTGASKRDAILQCLGLKASATDLRLRLKKSRSARR